MNKLLITFFCVFYTVISQAQNASLLAEEVKNFSTSALMEKGRIGISVRALATGELIFEDNSKKNMAPASNLKLLTTFAALGILGESYRFKTYIEYDGEVKDSILLGNLYVRGSGDPSLGSDRFKGFPGWEDLLTLFSKEVVKSGIKQVEGALVADASLFDQSTLPDHWPWGDLGNYYGAGVYGLNINENLYRVFYKAGKLGDSASCVGFAPPLRSYSYTNHVLAGPSGSGDKVFLYAAPSSTSIYMKGTVPQFSDRFAVRGAMPNPPQLLADLWYEKLMAQGVLVKGITRVLSLKSASSTPRSAIFTYESPKLIELVKQTNSNSVNLFAEAMLKACGLKVFKDPSFNSGVKAVQDFWKAKRLDVNGWFMFDGSGLSPNNSIAPATLSQALYIMSKDSLFSSFYSSLPVAGSTGTVYWLGKGTPIQGNMRVKSGTLSKVICYSGFVAGKSGKKYCFSVMCSNYNGTNSALNNQIEKVLISLGELP